MLLNIHGYFNAILKRKKTKTPPDYCYWSAAWRIGLHKLTYVTYENIIKINKVYLIKHTTSDDENPEMSLPCN